MKVIPAQPARPAIPATVEFESYEEAVAYLASYFCNSTVARAVLSTYRGVQGDCGSDLMNREASRVAMAQVQRRLAEWDRDPFDQ